MATFTNTTKHTSTSSNITKHTATFHNIQNSHGLYYITTDTPDYVLVGSSEDEYLIWDDYTSYKNLVKN